MKHAIFRRAALLSLLAIVSGPGLSAEKIHDLWIRNGLIVDGTGRAGFDGDVLIDGDTIVQVGAVDASQVKARETIDAKGRVVAPGFIDTHAHGDPLSDSFESFLAQGVTTVVLGQDGYTPTLDNPRAPLRGWLDAVERHGSEVNIAAMSGHGSLREYAGVGSSPVPTADQMKLMFDRLHQDMADGAFGLTFGLEYAPGRFSKVSETVALGDLAAREGGVVMSHMRTEDSGRIASAIDELLEIKGHVHVSHIKIVAPKSPAEGEAVLAQLARARANGQNVTADVYPYFASASSFYFLYPDWAKSEKDYQKAVQTRRAELEAHIRKRVEERYGPKAILFTDGPYAGKRLSEVAAMLHKPYEKAMIDDLGYDGPAQAHFIMSPEVQTAFIRADHVNICTDGSPGSTTPRAADSFVRILLEQVGPPPKMTLERAIQKMSGMAAEVIGIDRGEVVVGRKADLLVFDPRHIHSDTSWTRPILEPTGFDYIVVNGRVAWEDGTLLSRSGAVLRRKHAG